MYCKKAIHVTFICLASILVASSLFGQATGTLAGTVQDRSGAVVLGSIVTATSQETGAIRDTKTDDTGHYLLPLLPVGVYTLRVNAQNFQPVEQKDITLQSMEPGSGLWSFRLRSANRSKYLLPRLQWTPQIRRWASHLPHDKSPNCP